jgi:hypothetical protein
VVSPPGMDERSWATDSIACWFMRAIMASGRKANAETFNPADLTTTATRDVLGIQGDAALRSWLAAVTWVSSASSCPSRQPTLCSCPLTTLPPRDDQGPITLRAVPKETEARARGRIQTWNKRSNLQESLGMSKFKTGSRRLTQRILIEQSSDHRRVEVGAYAYDHPLLEVHDPAVTVVESHTVLGRR